MDDLVHNFGARKRKRGANFKRATGATPEVAGDVSQQPSEGGGGFICTSTIFPFG